ncbi:M23 family metallopeptidase [Pseudarthrobacter sp. NIBRBAC000502772]|uniref:M23 family metallopeptidase n=1 Tax=Pseudarthrobacter sp. NIBRBAC000502772 TaxID=2590775 RepID=UPI0011325611|nr:M23 family metallopeptidase [Pseudarthrobacter sp. NIBRBAC000502772]QDG65855.1 M23 family metallopeptidase [Pseudarthrobacter sp. NIBRBAC000502772]
MRHPVDYAPSQDFGDNPTAGLPASHWIIKQFGNYQPDGHTGTDYPCPVGTPVRAVADGTVLHAGYYGGTYADNPFWISPGFAGYCYVVDHGAFIGIYGHCRDGGALVHVGQRVTEGQILGPSGNTGASTGPHLHFEVLPDGYVLNSYMYGRINPARLFAGITAQSATITPLEDDMTPEERTTLFAVLDKINGNTDALPKPQYWNDLINAVARVDASASAPQLAAQINAAGLASAVRDELVKLIGGAK